MAEKAGGESSSYTAEECLKGGLADLVAAARKELIERLQGRTVALAGGGEVTLDLRGETIVELEMSDRQKFLRTITNPHLAYFLLIFGLLGLYIEFTPPGGVIPGILGGISLLLAFLAFQVLPINYVGLFLILLSIGFFIAEIKVQGFGVLGVGGIVSFVLGSIMLIKSPIPEMRPAMPIIMTFAVSFGCILLFLTWKVFQAMKRKKETGVEGLIGETGVARTDIDPRRGTVFVHGEWWNAVSDAPIAAGSKVEVESVKNLLLKVKKSGG
jgi:membrane-bound serine protease (ClpP class)